MKWLKLYTGIATDPKVGILSFDDRWHYVSLLCAKADGLMEEEPRLRDRLLRVQGSIDRCLPDHGGVGNLWLG